MKRRRIWILDSPLQRRIILVIGLGAAVMAIVLGIVAYLAVRESINRTLQERLALAKVVANYVEYALGQNLLDLEGLVPAGQDTLEGLCLEPQRRTLRAAYFDSIFDDRVFLVDRNGNQLCSEPASQALDPSFKTGALQALDSGKVIVTSMLTLEPGEKPVLAAFVPIRSRQGEIMGLVAGSVDLTGPNLSRIIATIELGQTGYVEVVDSEGVVLATTRSGNLLSESDHGNILSELIRRGDSAVRACHGCHEGAIEGRENEVMAFAPLASFPWGVTVRQSESEALALSRTLTYRFAIVGIVVSVFVLFLAVGIARGVIRPIRVLQRAAGRYARGELGDPIPPLGQDEVGQLGDSLDTMRARLKESLETIRAWNQELESRIAERTKILEDVQEARSDLLKRLISAQEEERKRIARELHDETGQGLARISMYLDRIRAYDIPVSNDLLDEARELLLRTADGINRLIYDLRPSILDDLGLVPALRWYADARLADTGTKVHWEIGEVDMRLPGPLETALYRVVQEAITNVARHANATNLIISIDSDDDMLTVEIEDDGRGFDANALAIRQGPAGLGILGMRERISIFNGEFDLTSDMDGGTYIRIRIPLAGVMPDND